MARYMRIDERGRNLLLDARGKLIHDYSLPPDQQPLYFPDARIVAGESSYEVRDALARMSPNDQAVLERVLVPKEGGCRVIASSQPPENGAGEPGRTVVGGDAWALAHLSYLMGMLRDEGGARDLALQYADDGPTSEWKEWHDCNLYLIGGPVLNAATRQVIDKVGSDAPHTLRYSFREHTIIDLETGDEVVGDARFFDEASQLRPKADGAILARVPNLLAAPDRERVAWLFAGCRTWGTLGALDALSTAEFRRDLCNFAAEHDSFQLVLEGLWTDRGPSSPQPWPDEVRVLRAWPHTASPPGRS